MIVKDFYKVSSLTESVIIYSSKVTKTLSAISELNGLLRLFIIKIINFYKEIL